MEWMVFQIDLGRFDSGSRSPYTLNLVIRVLRTAEGLRVGAVHGGFTWLALGLKIMPVTISMKISGRYTCACRRGLRLLCRFALTEGSGSPDKWIVPASNIRRDNKEDTGPRNALMHPPPGCVRRRPSPRLMIVSFADKQLNGRERICHSREWTRGK